MNGLCSLVPLSWKAPELSGPKATSDSLLPSPGCILGLGLLPVPHSGAWGAPTADAAVPGSTSWAVFLATGLPFLTERLEIFAKTLKVKDNFLPISCN